MLAQALQRESGAVVTIDASGLRQFDTSVLAVLLECERLAQSAGKSFELVRVPAKLTALARLYGLDVLLMPASAD
jgi:phospholipid transport system transporter-binding protein